MCYKWLLPYEEFLKVWKFLYRLHKLDYVKSQLEASGQISGNIFFFLPKSVKSANSQVLLLSKWHFILMIFSGSSHEIMLKWGLASTLSY